MKLRQEPFDYIVKGIKTIELRLNDEKRKLINIGDKITLYYDLLSPESVSDKRKGYIGYLAVILGIVFALLICAALVWLSCVICSKFNIDPFISAVIISVICVCIIIEAFIAGLTKSISGYCDWEIQKETELVSLLTSDSSNLEKEI